MTNYPVLPDGLFIVDKEMLKCKIRHYDKNDGKSEY
jgi:hypothetical protein